MGEHYLPADAAVVVPLVFMGIMLITVSARCWIRMVHLKAFAIDDWLLVLSVLIYGAMIGCGVRSSYLGAGKHISELTFGEIKETLELWVFEICFYLACTMAIKLSISFFLLRVAVKPIHRYIIYFTAMVYTFSSIAFIFNEIFLCHPVAYAWDKTIPNGYCRSTRMYIIATYLNAVFSAITDLIFSLLPLWIIWDLQMSNKSKTWVTAVLGLGVISTVATIVRFIYVARVKVNDDFLHNVADIALWGTIESALGIIAASLVSLRPILRFFLKTFGFSTLNDEGNSRSNPHSKPNNNGPSASAANCRQIRVTYDHSVGAETVNSTSSILPKLKNTWSSTTRGYNRSVSQSGKSDISLTSYGDESPTSFLHLDLDPRTPRGGGGNGGVHDGKMAGWGTSTEIKSEPMPYRAADDLEAQSGKQATMTDKRCMRW